MKRYTRNEKINKNQRIIIDKQGRIYLSGIRSLFLLKGEEFVKIFEKLRISKNRNFLFRNRIGEILLTDDNTAYKIKGSKAEADSSYNQFLSPDLTAFYESRSGIIWTGESNGVISRFDGKIIRKFSLPEKKRITNISEDLNGNIYFCTQIGLFKFENDKLDNILTPKDTLARTVISAFTDRENNIWACTNTGVYRISKNNCYKIRHNVIENMGRINAIAQDNKGDIWFGSNDKGIAIYDGKTFAPFSGFSTSARIHSIMCGQDKSVWIASNAGLFQIRNSNIKKYTKEDGLVNNIVASRIIEDKHSNIWFRNYKEICRFDGQKFHYNELKSADKTKNRIIKSISGSPLVVTSDGIFDEHDRLVFKITSDEFHKLYSKTVMLIEQDNDGTYWVCISGEGFCMLTKEGKFGRMISADDGLLDNYFFNSMIDSRGFLWLGNIGGFSRFDINTYKKTGEILFENYINDESYITSVVRCFFEDKASNIWIGTTHGLKRIDAKNLINANNIISPDVHITGLKLFLNKFDYSKFSDSLEKESGLPVNLTLPHDQNYLSFSFIGLNYSNPEEVDYRYSLSGFDISWSPIVKSNEITYTNLPHGNYKFMVKAKNKNGLWSRNQSEFCFTINQPYWQTWWFYSICLLIVAGTLYGYIKVHTFQLEKRKAELKKMVELRTLELRNGKEKVEAINQELEKSIYQLAQLNKIQGKWLQELSESEQQLLEDNRNKDKFFTIISHDLKSPFRALLMYSASVLKKIDSISKDEIKEYTLNITKSAQNVYNLLEDVLEWSRIKIGGTQFNPHCFDLSAVISQTVEILDGNIKKKKIRVINRTRSDLKTYADEQMIISVINNLISNAVKFTHPGGKIEIFSTIQPKMVEITVKDNGIGMNNEELGKLFRIEEHFFRNGTANETGTGLGLILCRELIEKNYGSIVVESHQNKGSLFRFSLPKDENVYLELSQG
ncbi:MAG: ATP-binding protein [Ignavibacteria bacterium]